MSRILFSKDLKDYCLYLEINKITTISVQTGKLPKNKIELFFNKMKKSIIRDILVGLFVTIIGGLILFGITSDIELNKKIKEENTNKLDYQHQKYIDQRDGGVYKIVEVGGITWMAENINYDAVNTFGLYDWYNATTKVCPEGWKLPSAVDWQILLNNFGGYVEVLDLDVPYNEDIKLRRNVRTVGNPEQAYGELIVGGKSNFHVWNSDDYWTSTSVDDEFAFLFSFNPFNHQKVVFKEKYFKSSKKRCRCIKKKQN